MIATRNLSYTQHLRSSLRYGALRASESMQAAGTAAYGTRRLTTCADSVVAARSNVAPEMFRAITRTVLFDHTAASSSMNRVDDSFERLSRLMAEVFGLSISEGAIANIRGGSVCRYIVSVPISGFPAG